MMPNVLLVALVRISARRNNDSCNNGSCDQPPAGGELVELKSTPRAHRAPSPTTANGAHAAGCASHRAPLLLSSRIDLRNASARPMLGSALISANARVVSFTAALEDTSQLETRRALAPDRTGPHLSRPCSLLCCRPRALPNRRPTSVSRSRMR